MLVTVNFTWLGAEFCCINFKYIWLCFPRTRMPLSSLESKPFEALLGSSRTAFSLGAHLALRVLPRQYPSAYYSVHVLRGLSTPAGVNANCSQSCVNYEDCSPCFSMVVFSPALVISSHACINQNVATDSRETLCIYQSAHFRWIVLFFLVFCPANSSYLGFPDL